MAQADRATVEVETVLGDADLLRYGARSGGEGLVVLVDVHVEDVEAVAFQQGLNGRNGRGHDALGFDACRDLIDDGGKYWPTHRCGKVGVGHEDRGRTVVERAGVAGRHAALPVKDGTEAGEAVGGGARTDALVDGDRYRVAPALWNGDGYAFPVEPSLGLGGGGALLALGGKGVHGLARDAAFLGDDFAGVAHVHVVVDVPQAVVNHRIKQGAVAHLGARTLALEELRCVGHALHAPGDDAAVLAGADGRGREHDGLQRGAADLVDRHRRGADRQACTQRDLPGGVLTGSGLQHLPHDDLVHDARRGVKAAAFDDPLHRDDAKVDGRHRREGAHEAGDGGPGNGAEHRGRHDATSPEWALNLFRPRRWA